MLRVTRIVLPSLTVSTLAVAWLHAVPTSNAYAQSQIQPPGLSDPAPNVQEQKLDAAAAAIKQIVSVKEDFERRLEAAAAPTERDRIADEAKTAIEKAVTDQGLSLPEYRSIMVIAQNDPEVEQKILQRLRSSGK
jgi:hypothetical protein